MLLLSGSLMGQGQKPGRQDSKAMRPKRIGLTEEQMTAKMVSELELDEKQQKKVVKLNKKYKTLIEGEQMPEFNGQRPSMGQGGRPGGRPNANFGGGRPGGMGGPGNGRPGGGMPRSGMQGGPRGGMPSGAQQSSYDYDKEQQKYDKQMRKLLSDEQYEGYLNINPSLPHSAGCVNSCWVVTVGWLCLLAALADQARVKRTSNMRGHRY